MNEELQILDLEALKGYLMIEDSEEMKAFLNELVPIFITDANKTFENIKRVVHGDDMNEIRAQAHSLKSCARNLALKRLAESCQTLESSAMNNEPIEEKIVTTIGRHKDEAAEALSKLIA